MPHMWRWATLASFVVSLPMNVRRFEALSATHDELRMLVAASARSRLRPSSRRQHERNHISG